MNWRKSPEALVQQFDTVVPRDPRIERRKMFGYPAAFVGGNLFMSLFQESLVLRLSDDDRAVFLNLPGASQFEPMPGRPMREYVTVPPSMLRHEPALAGWIKRSLDYATSIPAKGTGAKGARAKTPRAQASAPGTGPARRGAPAKRRSAKGRR